MKRTRLSTYLVVVVITVGLLLLEPCESSAKPIEKLYILNTTLVPRRFVTESLRRTGLNIQVSYRWTPPISRCMRDAYPAIYSYAAACYARLLLRRRKGLTLVIAPPFYLSNGQRAIGGVSVGSCNPTGFAIVFYDLNYSRKILKTILAHEVGHLLGASHDNRLPATYMHENAIPYYPASYSNKSMREIRECLDKLK